MDTPDNIDRIKIDYMANKISYREALQRLAGIGYSGYAAGDILYIWSK